MTTGAKPEPSSEGEAALPRAHVLGYLFSAAKPTQVRGVAADALVIVGYLTLVASLFIGALWIVAYPNLFARVFRLLHWPNGIVYMFHYDLPHLYVPFLLCPALLGASVAMVISARYVRRGLGPACLIGAAATVMVMLAVILGAAKIGVFALSAGFGLQPPLGLASVHPAQLWWLLATLALAPVATLLLDMISYLLWIFRNPILEKPSAPFLPRSSKRS